jgi:hypothetical protein
VKLKADAARRHVTIVEVRLPWEGVGVQARFPVGRLLWTPATERRSL